MKAIVIRTSASGATVNPLGGPQLSLGESGRGRTLVLVPVGLPESRENPFSLSLDLSGLPDVRVVVTDAGVRIEPASGGGSQDKILVALVGDPGYSRGRYYTWELPEGARILAHGSGAYGDAGRLGGWSEMLVVLPIPCELRSPAKYRHGRRVIVIREDAVQILTEEAYNASLAQKSAPEEVIE